MIVVGWHPDPGQEVIVRVTVGPDTLGRWKGANRQGLLLEFDGGSCFIPWEKVVGVSWRVGNVLAMPERPDREGPGISAGEIEAARRLMDLQHGIAEYVADLRERHNTDEVYGNLWSLADELEARFLTAVERIAADAAEQGLDLG